MQLFPECPFTSLLSVPFCREMQLGLKVHFATWKKQQDEKLNSVSCQCIDLLGSVSVAHSQRMVPTHSKQQGTLFRHLWPEWMTSLSLSLYLSLSLSLWMNSQLASMGNNRMTEKRTWNHFDRDKEAASSGQIKILGFPIWLLQFHIDTHTTEVLISITLEADLNHLL